MLALHGQIGNPGIAETASAKGSGEMIKNSLLSTFNRINISTMLELIYMDYSSFCQCGLVEGTPPNTTNTLHVYSTQADMLNTNDIVFQPQS